MGIVHPGIPELLVNNIRETFNIPNFVETGTYLGTTTRWASQRFNKVYTIERSKELYEQVTSKYGSLENVQFLLGDSREQLVSIGSKMHGSSVLWLDAHWSGGETYGENDECPLLDELRAIKSFPPDVFVLVDDARMFLCPPPIPHSPGYWPNIVNLLHEISNNLPLSYVVVIEDVIVVVPPKAKSFLINYCQNVSRPIVAPKTNTSPVDHIISFFKSK